MIINNAIRTYLHLLLEYFTNILLHFDICVACHTWRKLLNQLLFSLYLNTICNQVIKTYIKICIIHFKIAVTDIFT